MVDFLRTTLLLLLAVPVFADDNQITILQEGDNFELDITQIGFNNIIKQWTASEGIDGDDNTVIIKQARDRGTGTQPNTIELRRLWGDGNTLKLAQTRLNYLLKRGNFFALLIWQI